MTAGRLPDVEQSLLNNLSCELHYSSPINYSLDARRVDPGGESTERLAQRARPRPRMRCTGAACTRATGPCLLCMYLEKTQVYLITICVIFTSWQHFQLLPMRTEAAAASCIPCVPMQAAPMQCATRLQSNKEKPGIWGCVCLTTQAIFSA